MPFSLYAATIPSYLQILRSLAGLLVSAETFCGEKSLPAEALIQARLTEDMLAFAHQVKLTVAHSEGAIESARRGALTPDMSPPPADFAGLRGLVSTAVTALGSVPSADIDALLGRQVRLTLRDQHLDFAAEDFLLSFAQPNFYFHATTAYDILRWKGVRIGKRDFIGQLRTMKSA